MNSNKEKYVAFLRGINVGGHHKVPMADLRKKMEDIEFENVVTILNSGNIIFETKNIKTQNLEKIISDKLEKSFGFSVPTIVRKHQTISTIFYETPFKDILTHKDIRLYVSFLMINTPNTLKLPWTSDDKSYKIIENKERMVLSVLDLSKSKTPIAMKAFEQFFGKNNTTRNWNTIERIVNK